MATPDQKFQWDAVTTNADGSPLTDLTGYRIKFGKASGVYDTSSMDVGNVTEWPLTGAGLETGQEYFGVVVALNSVGAESAPSNEINFTIAAAPVVPSAPANFRIV